MFVEIPPHMAVSILHAKNKWLIFTENSTRIPGFEKTLLELVFWAHGYFAQRVIIKRIRLDRVRNASRSNLIRCSIHFSPRENAVLVSGGLNVSPGDVSDLTVYQQRFKPFGGEEEIFVLAGNNNSTAFQEIEPSVRCLAQ